jgi:phosphoserine phosphatase
MASDRPLAVFAYDFDGTLAPGNMQEHAFIPGELNMPHAEFWAESTALAKAQRGDGVHAYMHLMLEKARAVGADLSEERWRARGRSLTLFPGVEEWFERQNRRAEALGLDLRHFIISSGNREMIEGCRVASAFERIYASAFIFGPDGQAQGVALGVNYTNKTQYLFRINKWTLDEWDDTSINAAVPREERAVPFDRMVFFGDGETDVPMMRLVTDQGGYAVAVYDANRPKSIGAAGKLRNDGRAGYAGPADYRDGQPLDLQAHAMLEEMAARVRAGRAAVWPESWQQHVLPL